MKMRLGPLIGIGIGYLIGSGKGQELLEKAKGYLDQGGKQSSSSFGGAHSDRGMAGSTGYEGSMTTPSSASPVGSTMDEPMTIAGQGIPGQVP
jgi:hypothetical protein